jgi:hypothetical protein
MTDRTRQVLAALVSDGTITQARQTQWRPRWPRPHPRLAPAKAA